MNDLDYHILDTICIHIYTCALECYSLTNSYTDMDDLAI